MNDLPLSSEPDPREWLRFAQADLKVAQTLRGHPEILPNALAFHLQQAVEKAIKALLIQAGIRFPFTHDLERLFVLYQRAGHSLPVTLTELDELTPYAGHRRYPGWVHQPGEQELQRLLTVAEQVVTWAEGTIHPSSPPH